MNPTIPLFLSALSGCVATADQSEPEAVRTLADARASRVEVAALVAADAKLELDLPGEVGGERDANLAAANGGFVERVLVAEGDEVEKGQRLVQVDVGMYAAQLQSAEAQLQQASADLQRLRTLGDLASPAQLEAAATAERVATATVAQARNRLSRSVVKAPFAGVVAGVAVEPGEAVAPGAPVVRVVQLDPAVITLSVSDRDIVALVPGTEVTVHTQARAETFGGKVSRVSPAADLRTRAFPVEVEVDNPDRLLLPGMIARVTVDRPIARKVVVIPQDWLVTRRDKRGVFVVVDNAAQWRDVVLGEVIHDKVVVTDGIAPGDRVVVTGHRDLVDGDALVVTREGTCCEQGRPVFDGAP